MPRTTPDRLVPIAEAVPYRFRTWPIIKQWYWQDKEIQDVLRRANQLAEDLGWLNNVDTTQPPTT